MKLATFNVNGIRARLPRLIEWLDREKPEIVCLQELKCADEALPIADIEAAGYGAVWHGQKGFNGVAVLARGDAPELRRVGLPGDPDDTHSRYIEAVVDDVIVASIYLPNGNPVGTEKFEYKLAWMERLREHALGLLAEERVVVLAGDWTDCGMNAGCIEAAVMSGLQAANALLGRGRYHRIRGFYLP